MQIPYNYLPQKFADVDKIFADWRKLIASTQFTLGPFVEAFEEKFAAYVGAKYCVGTNTGTDALILALKALGVKPGDEVITVTNTFFATAGAIVAAGAKPVFVDCDDRFQIDLDQLEKAISRKTRVLLPVHWGGTSPDMREVIELSRRYQIPVLEDACHAVGAYIHGQHAGTFGDLGVFSMHPLKPLNVMGDGGMVVTNNEALVKWMRLYRNHGMVDRDHISMWGVNMRLQPLQAIVGGHILDTVADCIRVRHRNARLLDDGLKQLPHAVTLPPRVAWDKDAFQLYLACFKDRDRLLAHLIANGIEAKIHYPLPLHLQEAAASLGYKAGDFPKAEQQAKELISLPCHEYVSAEQISYLVQTIRSFYQQASKQAAA